MDVLPNNYNCFSKCFPEVHMEWVCTGSAQFWLGGAEKAVLEEQMLGLRLRDKSRFLNSQIIQSTVVLSLHSNSFDLDMHLSNKNQHS